MQEIYEPLSRYKSEFRQKFHDLAKSTFDFIKKESGVDAALNAATIKDLKKILSRITSLENKKYLHTIVTFIAGIWVAGSIIFAFIQFFDPQSRVGKENEYILWSIVALLSAALAAFLLFFKLLPAIKSINKRLLFLRDAARAKEKTAWEQMAPLNALYSWEILPYLIAKTVPLLELDPIFHEGRLMELQEKFDLSPSFNENKSVVEALSGSIAGNPFVLTTLRRQEWGEETYTGYLEITWTETYRDSDGKLRTAVRTQTLSASVTKPKPLFIDENQLLYGNETAPDLFFTRVPSELSGGEGGFFHRWRKARKLRKLKKFAQDLTDDSNFTMMSNEEFEVLFHAKDRTDEVQFRLLFTALAQQQMVNLLNDKAIGFGDDFTFAKLKKMNIVSPDHLQKISLSCDPAQFHNMDLAAAEKFFMERCESYFRHFYFTFAPLLVIPAYQNIRPWDSIYEPYKNMTSFWEQECLVNFWGEKRFAHPLSETGNILKATPLETGEDGTKIVGITSYGFKTILHTDYIPVFGGDGKFHSVPVDWYEYIPVEQSSRIALYGGETPDGTLSPETHRNLMENLSAQYSPEYLVSRKNLIGVFLGEDVR